jgi:hypothetical protein
LALISGLSWIHRLVDPGQDLAAVGSCGGVLGLDRVVRPHLMAKRVVPPAVLSMAMLSRGATYAGARVAALHLVPACSLQGKPTGHGTSGGVMVEEDP